MCLARREYTYTHTYTHRHTRMRTHTHTKQFYSSHTFIVDINYFLIHLLKRLIPVLYPRVDHLRYCAKVLGSSKALV